VDDASLLATGYNRGLYVCYNNDGDKTGDAQIEGVSADMFINQDVPFAYPFTCYVETSGNPAIGGLLSGLFVYITDPGTACQDLTGVDIGLQGDTNSPLNRHAFIRMRNHSPGAVPDCGLLFEGDVNADYFASWQYATLPIVVAAVGGAQTHKIRVRVQGVDYFIPLHTA